MRPPTPADLARLEVAQAIDRLLLVERGDIQWAEKMRVLADVLRQGTGAAPIYDERPPAPVLRLVPDPAAGVRHAE